MKVIYGKVKNLKVVNGIVGQLAKLQSQAVGTALVSLFSESGGMGAAATLAGVTGFPGYYIHFQIADIELYAAFTGVFFKEDDEIYVVFDEKTQNNFNVLSIMNKNNQLLAMAVPFGHTVSMSNKLHNKSTIFMGLAISILGSGLFFFLGLREVYVYIYIYIYILVFTTIMVTGIGQSVKKQFRGYALVSEKIYKKMGVTDLTAMEKAGVQPYIDENKKIYEDVYNYTQFLDYDPKPIVDIKEEPQINESHLRES